MKAAGAKDLGPEELSALKQKYDQRIQQNVPLRQLDQPVQSSQQQNQPQFSNPVGRPGSLSGEGAGGNIFQNVPASLRRFAPGSFPPGSKGFNTSRGDRVVET